MPLTPLHNSNTSPGSPLDSGPEVLCLDSVTLSDVWDFLKNKHMYQITCVQQGEGSALHCFPNLQLDSVKQGCILNKRGVPKDRSTGLLSGLDFESPIPLGSQRKTSKEVLCLPNTRRQQTERAFSEFLQTDNY